MNNKPQKVEPDMKQLSKGFSVMPIRVVGYDISSNHPKYYTW